jgi:4-hydroxybenzoate polyprenyltransferase
MMSPVLRLLRPGDWVKNVFVLPAFVFALPTAQQPDLARWTVATLAAVIAFCLIASGFYSINDVLDAEQDRLHPIKRLRPVASGEVSPRTAMTLGITLIVSGLIVGAAVNRKLLFVLLLYAMLQAAYNARLKHVNFVDVVCLAIGFSLRAAAGAVAISVELSVWLVLCVFFLCLYLGFIKRLCDLTSAAVKGDTTWRSPAGYDNMTELNWLLGVSAVLAVMTYIMYTVSEHARAQFGQVKQIGFALMAPLVLIAVHRFYRRASRGVSDSPLDALRSDLAVLASVVLFAVGTVLILYVPQLEQILRAVFVVEPGVRSL